MKAGYDCDDYAGDAKRWIDNFMPGHEAQILGITWEDSSPTDALANPKPEPEKHGHAVLQIKVDGSIYILEPQTGDVFPGNTP